ncbi:MAG: HlyD family efflux transporter periplasmic adaptor subunit [Bacteroidota bacterium]
MMKSIQKLVLLCVLGIMSLTSCGVAYEETQPIRKPITITVFASGTLEARNQYELTARADGYLDKLFFEEDQQVAQGQLLAVIDNRQNLLNAQRSESLYQIAKSNSDKNAPLLVQAKNTVNLSYEQMLQDSLIASKYQVLSEARAVAQVEYQDKHLKYKSSLKEYQNALQQYEWQKKTAEEQLVINESQKEVNQTLSSYNQLRAVNTGKVFRKLKEEGDFVHQGEAIAIMGDASRLFARVEIDEQSIGKIEVGQDALIELNTEKGRTYRAKVAEILPTFDESSQSFTAKLAFSEPVAFSILNTQLQANIIIETVDDALLIPRRFLGYGDEVMLKGEQEPSVIETKIVSSKWVQVTSGLDETDVILTRK